MIRLHSIVKMQQIQKDTKNLIFMHIALLVFSKKIWNKFKRFKLRLQTIYQFLAETLLLTSWGQQLTELRQEYKKMFSLSQSDDPTKKGAKIQNEYMFLLRCIMATSWIGNLYFSTQSFGTSRPAQAQLEVSLIRHDHCAHIMLSSLP